MRTGPKPMTVEERVQRCLDRTIHNDDGCWVWQGTVDNNGYPTIHVRPRTLRVHRFLYAQLVRNPPPGLVLHHVCFNKRCVNPDHLEELTRAEHKRVHPYVTPRSEACFRGHQWTPDNTYVGNNGQRFCRACGHIRAAKLWAAGRYSRQRATA